MSSEAVSSLELWASAKIIGRECATVNKEYLLCRKNKGVDPRHCLDQGDNTITCTSDIVSTVREKFPTELSNFVKCLDKGDYRNNECRKEEAALHACWNTFKGYK